VALAHRTNARQVVGIPDADVERAGEMLGEAIMRAVHEAAEAIPGLDASTWDLVLIELLAPPKARPDRSGQRRRPERCEAL
jgi:hypothetical protein